MAGDDVYNEMRRQLESGQCEVLVFDSATPTELVAFGWWHVLVALGISR